MAVGRRAPTNARHARQLDPGGVLIPRAILAAALYITAAALSIALALVLAPALAACSAASPSQGDSAGSDGARPACEPGVRIEVRSPVEVSGEAIRLGDIAAMSGASGDALEKLAALEVGKAPLPGQERTLSMAIIRIRLRQAGFDPESMWLVGPSTILVKARARKVAQEEVAQAVRDYIAAALPWDERDTEVRVSLAPGDILVPDGHVTLRVEPLPTTRLIGSTSLRVTVLVDGEPCRVLPVRVRVDAAQSVMVAARTIARYETISASDLRAEVRDLADVPKDVVTDPSRAVGMRATHTIQAGRALALADLEPPPIVHKGDLVTIQATFGGVAVMSPGEALEDGHSGAQIRVRNCMSGTILRAVVVDENTVRI